MIYILDAYNIIHKIPALESLLDRDLPQHAPAKIK